MKILFVGDSYSTNYSDLSWPAIIEKHFNCKSKNLSRPASSLNYSFNSLILDLKSNSYDVVVFTTTSSDRIYHSDMIIHSQFPQMNDGSQVSKDIKESIDLYYKNLYDQKNQDIHWKIFCRALLYLSLEYSNTKFIIVNAFEFFDYFDKGNCVLIDDTLIQYSLLDKEGHRIETLGEMSIDRYNHLTIRQNQTLASHINKFIEEYKFGKITRKKLKGMDKL